MTRRGKALIAITAANALIGRDWYDITSWTMTADGRCAKCGAACGGVFEANPGAWGARRLPIRVSAA